MSDIVTILGILRRGMYDDKRGYLLIYLLFTTGLSTWSIFSLRWGDIQYNSKAGSMMLRVQVKTKGEDREIYVILSDESLRLLCDIVTISLILNTSHCIFFNCGNPRTPTTIFIIPICSNSRYKTRILSK